MLQAERTTLVKLDFGLLKLLLLLLKRWNFHWGGELNSWGQANMGVSQVSRKVAPRVQSEDYQN
jgi:hypothetical protein